MTLSSVSRGLENKDFGALSGITFEALLFILNKHRKPFCLLAPPSVVEHVAIVYQERIGVDVACVVSQEGSSAGPLDQYDSSSFISTQRLASGVKENLFCFVEESLFRAPLIPAEKSKPFVVESKTTFDLLLVSLKSLGYKQKQDFLVPGSFLVRGGIVDVFLFHSNQIFRVSFLQTACYIYTINKNTNKITGRKNSLLIYPLLRKKRLSLDVFLPSNYIIYCYDGKTLKHKKSKEQKTLSLGCSEVDYQGFIKYGGRLKSHPLEFLYERGFLYEGVLFVPDWFTKTAPSAPLKQKVEIPAFGALEVGGVYVHDDFGFCLFLGFETTKKQEKACLQFADGIVRLDIDYMSKLSFVSTQKKGGLSFLNRPGLWKRKRNLAEKQAEAFVGNLVQSYNKREGCISPPLKTADEMIDFFVRSFQYQETADQLSCWTSLLQDLGSPSPMNRLICGDVGFGKTELAIRAAFVSVFNNQQVLVLAPTTILANQLYHSFVARLSEFGVVVACLSRITKNKQKTLNLYINKKTDVLIGTMALVFQKPLLKQCGLFVVDEEHRFGVKKKERVFQYSPGVNFLSMSATPIPRSLQLSLSGVRNFSLIQTPPLARKPIISSMKYFSIGLIKAVVLKEFARNGQVFFVDNSIPRLKRLFSEFVEIFPDFKIDILFGSLENNKIIQTMDAFINGKTRMLLSTTIIESGIDVGTTNTIIINNAHLFGLSQLYQLRGRVGRSALQAFAWFLIPKRKKISSNAMQRLKTIVKYNALGSGYQIAQADLDLRGGGSLFGYQQSGASAVGFEYYTKLLSRVALPDKKGECLVRLFSSRLSRSFLAEENERAFYYKKIFSAKSKEELLQIKQDLIDLFGCCLPEVEGLIKNRLLGLRAADKNISKISRDRGVVSVSFNLKKTDPKIDNTISFISSFCIQNKLDFWFINSYKNLIFQYKSVGKDDYILLLSFINKFSFF